tara:strand:- start:170 stop:358 length:189 start_codon:yes stop_codon:yes gene_type:complete
MKYEHQKLSQPALKTYVLEEISELQNLFLTYEKLIKKEPAPNHLIYIKSYLMRLYKSIEEFY